MSGSILIEKSAKFLFCDLQFKKQDFIEELSKAYAIIAMRLLFNLFTVLALTSRPNACPSFAVAAGLGFAGNDKMPKDMFYGMYALRDRYSMDQVPLQNRGAKHTVEYKGKRYVYAKHRSTF